MPKHLIITLCMLGLLAGCGQPKWPEPPQKPNPHPEMSKLKRLVGSWKGTGELVSPSAGKINAMMPEDAEEMPSSFAGGGRHRMALGGMLLQGESWHEMGDGQKATYIEYWSWDPKAKKYRIWYFSDWGETGTGWAEFDEDGNTLRTKARGTNFHGKRSRGHGTQTFIDKNTIEWTWTERGPDGRMEFKGTSKRTR